MGTELDSLAATLGVSPSRLAPFASYEGRQLAALDALITATMTAEDKAFDAALEEALGFVPRLLRPTAKRMLFGGGRG